MEVKPTVSNPEALKELAKAACAKDAEGRQVAAEKIAGLSRTDTLELVHLLKRQGNAITAVGLVPLAFIVAGFIAIPLMRDGKITIPPALFLALCVLGITVPSGISLLLLQKMFRACALIHAPEIVDVIFSHSSRRTLVPEAALAVAAEQIRASRGEMPLSREGLAGLYGWVFNHLLRHDRVGAGEEVAAAVLAYGDSFLPEKHMATLHQMESKRFKSRAK